MNQRYIPNFAPDDAEGYITLSTHNTTAQQINSDKLRILKTALRTFEAAIEGDFPAHAYPTDVSLDLKVGAQVMFVKNDISRDKLYYNGKIGRITDIDDDVIYVTSQHDGQEIEVYPAAWTNIRYSIDPTTKEIKGEPIGTFTQFPLKTRLGHYHSQKPGTNVRESDYRRIGRFCAWAGVRSTQPLQNPGGAGAPFAHSIAQH